VEGALTVRARRILRAAQAAASGEGRHGVGTEHILLAIIGDPRSAAADVLRLLGVVSEDLQAEIAHTASLPGRDAGELEAAVDAARAEARAWSHSYVCSEHLLLGTLRAGLGHGATILTQLGVTINDAQRATARLLGASVAEQASIRVRSDQARGRSISAEIVARVREGVATQRLRLGDRLPTVRRLAAELDVAPGTVARAYTELARLGLIVTSGVHGTRISSYSVAPVQAVDPLALAELLRPVAVTAFHMGATATLLRAALESAMAGILVTRAASP
jgi:DNA-binding transcriptional regulator YhcF (GntR family)